MKSTTFEFRLRLTTKKSVDQAVENVAALKGVDEVAYRSDAYGTTFLVTASFETSDSAKRLHRKVMGLLMTLDGIAIESVTTNLTDVFGK